MSVIQVCARCAGRWPVLGAPAQWCPRCHGVLLAPIRTEQQLSPDQRGFRWVARPPLRRGGWPLILRRPLRHPTTPTFRVGDFTTTSILLMGEELAGRTRRQGRHLPDRHRRPVRAGRACRTGSLRRPRLEQDPFGRPDRARRLGCRRLRHPSRWNALCPAVRHQWRVLAAADPPPHVRPGAKVGSAFRR